MRIVHIHAVYKSWPIMLVVQTETGEVLELSLNELQKTSDAFDEQVWKQLVEEYKVFQYSKR
ncbi:MAG TPA: hypothetical protein VIH59_33780 [Candidatus Tectomicrobia bacterium]